jgi:saxitoxin biosynthesis operon SxtJ-like protein
VLFVFALLQAWRGHAARAAVAAAAATVLVGCALTRPALLERPAAWWRQLSRALGYVNSRVLLTLLFAVVFVPMAAVWRIAGIDPLGRAKRRWTGWSVPPASRRTSTHYTRMY